MLHVTNGDSAAQVLRAAGVAGEVLPWRDVLHAGPVPAGLDPEALRAVRARFLASMGWTSEEAALADMAERDARLDDALAGGEPIVLWFESDLYDQLQLAQILDRVTWAGASVRLVLIDEGNGEAFRAVPHLRREKVASRLGSALIAHPAPYMEAWDAFRAADPRGLEPLASGSDALGVALRRALEELPWTGSGLTRTEGALLRAAANGARTPVDAFESAQAGEERPFLGDTLAFALLARLQAPPAPLLDADLAPTAHGEAVLAGSAEWAGQPPRELGGLRLSAGTPEWRWDAAAGRVSAAA